MTELDPTWPCVRCYMFERRHTKSLLLVHTYVPYDSYYANYGDVVTEKPKNPSEGTMYKYDDAGQPGIEVFTGGAWVVAMPGDTYKGKILIPVPKKPLPPHQNYAGGLRLIRGWNVQSNPGGPSLHSFNTPFEWTDGVLEAHALPNLGRNNVGFFGFHKWDYADRELSSHPSCIRGTYFGWGRVVRGEMGFRTQYARMEALVDPGPTPSFIGAPTRDTVQAAADKLGILFLTMKEIVQLKTGLIPATMDRLDPPPVPDSPAELFED